MKKICNTAIIATFIILLSSCGGSGARTNPYIGNPEAKILIEEFSDFECPACGAISLQLEDIALRNKNKVQLKFYHFPLSYHKHAFMAAEAAECANDQGKFWEYAKTAFKNQNNLSEDNLKAFAASLGLNTEVFNKCLESGAKKSGIQADINEGRRRQLGYTPSLYVNGKLVQWSTAEEFENYIKSL